MRNIDTNEVKRILEMHSKLKKKPILEQNAPDNDNDVNPNVSGVNPSIKNTPKVNQDEVDLKLIRDAKTAKCLKNGKEQYLKGTKKPVYVVTTAKSGKVVVFYPDMTYKFKDGSKSGKWKCDELVTLTSMKDQKADQESKNAQLAKDVQLTKDAQNKKQQYIDKFTKAPYNYKFNVKDIDKQKYTELDPVNDLKVPAGVFAVTDKFYSDPSVNKDIKGRSDSSLNDVLENQSINRNACRKNVEDYFKSFKRKNSIVIDGPTFEKAKRIVQSCKDEHYGKWGIAGGGNKLDNYLDILSGVKEGGPTSYGNDSKWRIQ